MAKVKDYHLVVLSQTLHPTSNKVTSENKVQETVTGAKAAATRATSLIRGAKREGIDNRLVQVYDADTRKPVMLCQGPAIMGRYRGDRERRAARRSFAQCHISQKAFKTAIKAKPKRRK